MAGCPDCGLPLCNQCIDIKISSGTNTNTNTNTETGTNKKKSLIWHEAECRLLKNNSVRVSLEEKDEKEASKVVIIIIMTINCMETVFILIVMINVV